MGIFGTRRLGFRWRKTFRVGPLFLSFNQNGFASWGVKLGRFTRNFTRGTTTLDTPGPGGLHLGRKPRRTSRRRGRQQ